MHLVPPATLEQLFDEVTSGGNMPGYEAEETIKRIKSHKGVQAVLIVNQEGVPIYSSTIDEEFAMDHAALISQLAAKAKSTIRTLDPTNDMTFLRIRSKKHEIMIAPDKEYALIVIQNPNPGAAGVQDALGEH